MKRTALLTIFITLLFITSCNQKNKNTLDKKKQIATAVLSENSLSENNDQTKLKRYKMKSGIVKYKSSVSGKVMGQTITGNGTKEIYFKDWGNVELVKVDEKKVTKINIFGQKKTEVSEIHTINKLDNGKSYSVDTKKKVIYLSRDMAMEMTKTFNDGDAVEPGKSMLEGMGGEKIGTEKILNYNCEVWKIPGGKQWMYKGLPLKLEMTVMGTTSTLMVTSAKFNTSVPDKYFELPDYPIQEMEGYQNDEEYAKDKAEMKKNAKKMQKMTYAEYKAMVLKEDPNVSEEELKTGYKMMKKMTKKMSK